MRVELGGAVLIPHTEGQDELLVYAPLILCEPRVVLSPRVRGSVRRLKVVKRYSQQKIGEIVARTDAAWAHKVEHPIADEIKSRVELIGREGSAKFPVVPSAGPRERIAIGERITDQRTRPLDAEAKVSRLIVKGESGASQFQIGCDPGFAQGCVCRNCPGGFGFERVRALHRGAELVQQVARESMRIGNVREIVMENVCQRVPGRNVEADPCGPNTAQLGNSEAAEGNRKPILLADIEVKLHC